MPVYWLGLDKEHHVCKGWVVDNCSHVYYKVGHCLVVDFVLFKFSDIQNANIIEPLAPVKSSKNEKLFCANHASGVSLPTSWCLLEFQRMTPSHGLSVQDIEVVRGYYLLETATSAVITAKEIDFVTDQVGGVSSKALRRTSTNLRLGPT